MNLMNFIQGKGTYSTAYAAMLAGVYLMAATVGNGLVPPVDYVVLIGEVLKSEGFMYFVGGAGLFFIRRAMEKGGAAKPPLTEEEKLAEAERLKALLTDVETQLQRMKT